MTCVLCDEPIMLDDDPARPVGVADSDGNASIRYMHRECGLREVMGGVGHLVAHEYWCGEPRHDPDAGLTYRQSALLVDAWVRIVGLPGD